MNGPPVHPLSLTQLISAADVICDFRAKANSEAGSVEGDRQMESASESKENTDTANNGKGAQQQQQGSGAPSSSSQQSRKKKKKSGEG